MPHNAQAPRSGAHAGAMKITIDTEAKTLECQSGDAAPTRLPLYSPEAFRLVSEVWLKQEWNQLHWQSFSWLGFQLWQLPEDVLRLQEVVASVRPDVIIETGVNRGGSAVFFASLCRALGRGRVISIDIHVPPEVREAVAVCPLGDLITLIEGDSAAPAVVERVRRSVGPGQTVLVFLDSDHSREHVRRELDAYGPLVTPGSYIVATDGVMQQLADTPLGQAHWRDDNPAAAARAYAAEHPEFALRRPIALYNDALAAPNLTYWPDAWLYRLHPPPN